jgi:hypothetical protein
MNPETEEHFNRCSDDILLLASVTGVEAKRISDALINLCEKLSKANEQIEEIIKPFKENPPEDIPWLKRQIKHCKNPLEEKALRKRLNEATRNSRRKRM